MSTTDKIVIHPNSGGFDTLAATKILFDKGYKLHSFFLDHNQPNVARAMKSAEKIADKYCVSHEVITIRSDKRQNFSRVPDKNKINNNFGMPRTESLVFVYASILSTLTGSNTFSLGGFRPLNNETDEAQLERLLAHGMRTRFSADIEIIRPFKFLDKYDPIALFEYGLKNLDLKREDFEQTVSCNDKMPCGTCCKCEIRKNINITLN